MWKIGEVSKRSGVGVEALDCLLELGHALDEPAQGTVTVAGPERLEGFVAGAADARRPAGRRRAGARGGNS